MPNKLRSDVSSTQLVKFFEKNGFEIKRKTGSHIIIGRIVVSGKQVLVVPDHKVIPKGTLKAIYNQASRYISESELFDIFYLN